MSTLIYVDTNVYLDFLLDRHNEYGKYLGDDAFSIFNRAMRCEFTILISYTVLEELFRNYPSEKTNMLFAFLKKKLMKVIASDEDISLAKTMQEPYQDALHALLAKKYNVKYLVTRNMRDFEQHRHLVTPVYPDQI